MSPLVSVGGVYATMTEMRTRVLVCHFSQWGGGYCRYLPGLLDLEGDFFERLDDDETVADEFHLD